MTEEKVIEIPSDDGHGAISLIIQHNSDDRPLRLMIDRYGGYSMWQWINAEDARNLANALNKAADQAEPIEKEHTDRLNAKAKADPRLAQMQSNDFGF